MTQTRAELHHGDCLEVMPKLAPGSVTMAFADLPYGITSRNKWDVRLPLSLLWTCFDAVCVHNYVSCFTATQPFASELVQSRKRFFRYDLVWDKRSPTGHLNAKRQPLRRHEQILIFAEKSARYNPIMTEGKRYVKDVRQPSTNYGETNIETVGRAYTGLRYPTSIIAQPSARGLHPTQKPVALLIWLIETYTNPGDIVLDPVMGSGTTGVACKRLGRHFIGIEKDETYFNAAKARIDAEPWPTTS